MTTTPVTEHMARSHAVGVIPKDPYSQGAYLLMRDEEDITDFQKMASRVIMLARIPAHKIPAYMDAVNIMTQLYGCARRDPDFVPFFKEIWYGFKLELDTSRSEGGAESDAQHNTGKFKVRPDPDFYPMELDGEKDLIGKLKSNNQQQK